MGQDSPESNVVAADFREHRRQIAVENSPFGPVVSGLVEIEIPEEPQLAVKAHHDRFNPVVKGHDASERTYVDPVTNQRFYDL